MRTTKSITQLSLAVIGILCLGLSAYGQDTSDHIKYVPGQGLQVAVTEYVAPNSSVTLTLYGVVHVGESKYYDQVQKNLDKFDTVLYEGVKSGAKPNPETVALNTMQKLMGLVLGLKFQKDGIDYTRKNLVHADISMDELQKSLDGKSLTPLGQYLDTNQLESFLKTIKPFLDLAENFLQEWIKTNPEFQTKIKAQFAQQLGQADINKQMSPEMYKAIVLDRNQIVIDVFQEQLQNHPEKKSYAIFYGAAHMPDFEKRLAKMGYTQKSKRWETAWEIKEIQSDDEDDENK